MAEQEWKRAHCSVCRRVTNFIEHEHGGKWICSICHGAISDEMMKEKEVKK